jgi:hypothetical protein
VSMVAGSLVQYSRDVPALRFLSLVFQHFERSRHLNLFRLLMQQAAAVALLSAVCFPQVALHIRIYIYTYIYIYE